jgi:hypothetical protein
LQMFSRLAMRFSNNFADTEDCSTAAAIAEAASILQELSSGCKACPLLCLANGILW